jgi:HPt (histidine-containing phosphotransfer) domain-containing protein
MAVLAEIQADLGDGDPAIVVEIIDLFLADLPQQLSTLREGFSAGETSVVQRLAHTIKASAATIGALALAADCETLETSAHGGVLPEAGAHLTVIEADAAAVREELTSIRHRLATAAPPCG